MLSSPVIWALCDDRSGHAAQVRGVAESLTIPFLIQSLSYTTTAGLPNYVVGASFAGLSRDARINLVAPWPDLVIAAGRRTAPVARRIKELSGGKTFLTQIMHPGKHGMDDFDLICVGRHDQRAPHGLKNFLSITGAPHRINEGAFAEAAHIWKGRFDHLPHPLIALMVGGATKRRQFTAQAAAELGQRVNDVAKSLDGSLLISTSRRTGEAAQEALLGQITVPSHVFSWGDRGDNPYVAYLALADAVVVTGDSVSMCSEACAGETPVYIYAPPDFVTRKHALLHEELYQLEVARPFVAPMSLDWTHRPLNAAEKIAGEIKKRMGLV